MIILVASGLGIAIVQELIYVGLNTRAKRKTPGRPVFLYTT